MTRPQASIGFDPARLGEAGSIALAAAMDLLLSEDGHWVKADDIGAAMVEASGIAERTASNLLAGLGQYGALRRWDGPYGLMHSVTRLGARWWAQEQRGRQDGPVTPLDYLDARRAALGQERPSRRARARARDAATAARHPVAGDEQ